jgi:hypothetical protein
MEYLKNINNLSMKAGIQNNAKHDNSIKEIYSCGRKTEIHSTANFVGILAIICVISFVVYKISTKKSIISMTHVFDFAASNEIFKMFISILLLTNIKTLSDSFVYHIILPVIKPILPFLACNLKLKLGLFTISLGEFISDVLVFLINLYAIYIMYIVTH